MPKEFYPTIEELRASQKKGAFNEGLNATDCTELNAVQGHKVDIREHIEGMPTARAIREGMIEGNQRGHMDCLDRTNRAEWPDITEL